MVGQRLARAEEHDLLVERVAVVGDEYGRDLRSSKDGEQISIHMPALDRSACALTCTTSPRRNIGEDVSIARYPPAVCVSRRPPGIRPSIGFTQKYMIFTQKSMIFSRRPMIFSVQSVLNLAAPFGKEEPSVSPCKIIIFQWKNPHFQCRIIIFY